jgi:hypothetical protein
VSKVQDSEVRTLALSTGVYVEIVLRFNSTGIQQVSEQQQTVWRHSQHVDAAEGNILPA